MSVVIKCLRSVQDNLNVLLYPYLQTYLKWAKGYAIPFYDDYLRDNISVITNAYTDKKMVGGKGEMVDKLNKIYQIAKTIQTHQLQLNSDDLKKVDELLTQLEGKIKNITLNEKGVPTNQILVGNTLINADMVQSTIETIKMGLINLNDIDITKEYNRIPTRQLKGNYTELKINEIFDEFHKSITDIEKIVDEQERQRNVDLLTKELSEKRKTMEEKIVEMNKVIDEMGVSINDIFDNTKYKFNKDELMMIPIFDTFLNEINLINEPKIKHIVEETKKIMQESNLSNGVEYFNNEITSFTNTIRDKTKYKKFTKYYDGINNVRINNMFFATKGVVDLQNVRDMINSDQFPELKVRYDNDEQLINAFLELPIQKGGDLESFKKQITQNGEFMRLAQKYNDTINTYRKMTSQYQTLLLNQFMHNIFLVTIVTNQLTVTGSIIHEYIQRGTLTLYNRILKSMMKSMNDKPNIELNKYLSKYHKITIYKLYNFTKEIIDYLNKLKDEKMRTCEIQQCNTLVSGMTKQECTKKRKQCLEDDVVDINACDGETANRFLLLNYFKGILMQYNAMSGSKIAIYARINDLGQTMIPSSQEACHELMYLSSFDKKARGNVCGDGGQDEKIDIQEMNVEYKTCQDTQHLSKEKINFTEVFDSTQFPTSSEISKYMSINTLLEQGNGIGIMTYGYSGTGKSFTLFGNSGKNISGILQTTLGDMNGLKNVKFRIMELYGYGMPYPYYWEMGTTNIKHNIYDYKLSVSGNGLDILKINEIGSNDMEDYMNCVKKYETTYVDIPENYVNDVFKKFETFVTKIDDRRVETKRIRDTPNNIVSSRSVIIYDFQLTIQGKSNNIPFLIIDLPGREEIIQTYVEPYIGSKTIQNLINIDHDALNEIKLLLGFMSINPLGIPILAYKNILKVVTDDIKKNVTIKNQIIGVTKSTFYILKNATDTDQHKRIEVKFPKTEFNITEETDKYAITGNFELLNEFVSQQEAKDKKGKLIGTGSTLNKWFNIKDDEFIIKGEAKGYGYNSNEQLWIVLCIHLMNRVIMSKNFILLEKIIKNICDEKINSIINSKIKAMDVNAKKELLGKLQEGKFKALFWLNNDTIERIVTDEEKMKKITNYDYYLTPYEGLYINENIIGLIKYLSFKKILDGDVETPDTIEKANTEISKKITSQDKSLVFSHQQKMIRLLMVTKEPPEGSLPIHTFYGVSKNDIPKNKLLVKEDDRKVKFNHLKNADGKDAFEIMYEQLKNTYRSDKIFNFKEPIITKILEPYMKKLFGYDILYLLANYKDENIRNSRCGHQQKLLGNTLDFIKTIVNV